ncbi:MAG: AI-2E family transporter [Parcubacteria group bacterium]|nr:AI-2E family transporter [Parcubacteria group bacterium]
MNEPTRTIIEIDWRTIWRILMTILAVWLAYYLRDVVILILFAVVIAAAVDPAARWMQRRRIPRAIAVIAIYLASFLVFSVLVYVVVQPLVSELRQFSHDFPRLLEERFGFITGDTAASIPENVRELLGRLVEQLGSVTTGALGALLNFFGGIVPAFAVLVISLYLSIREEGIEHFLRTIVPAQAEERVLRLWDRTKKRIGRWLQGQILLIVIIGACVYVGLRFILHVKYALTLAVIAGLLEIVPVVGPIASVIPAVIVALFQSQLHVLGVLILYFVVQQLENHVIVPQLIQKLVGVDALVVIIALLIGGQLAGISGVILAVPIAAAITEVVSDVQKNRGTDKPQVAS